jgi:hypothetical protein
MKGNVLIPERTQTKKKLSRTVVPILWYAYPVGGGVRENNIDNGRKHTEKELK